MYRIGVLSLQGSVREHLNSLDQVNGIISSEVNNEVGLQQIDGLIIPGGESTTIGKLIKDFGLFHQLVHRIQSGMPVWGTCAGMILLAKKIVDEEEIHLGVMDIAVKRNAYGSQLDSFRLNVDIPELSNEEIPLVFVRAPMIETMGNNVKAIAFVNGRPVAVKQGNILATAFHPELTNNISFHKYFANMVGNT